MGREEEGTLSCSWSDNTVVSSFNLMFIHQLAGQICDFQMREAEFERDRMARELAAERADGDRLRSRVEEVR